MTQPTTTTDTDTHAVYMLALDGAIWLECECEFRQRLGYTTTPEEAWAAEQAHRTTVFKGPDVVHSSP
jgi:hypothetical protein